MFFYYMFDFGVHVIDGGVDLVVKFMDLLDRFFVIDFGGGV